MTNQFTLPSIGFLRLDDVLRVIPVSKSHWWAGVKDGRYPAAIKLGERITVWKAEEVHAFIASVANGSLPLPQRKPVSETPHSGDTARTPAPAVTDNDTPLDTSAAADDAEATGFPFLQKKGQ